MQSRLIPHVFVLHQVLVIGQYFGVARVPETSLVMDIELFMVVAIVAAWSAPCGELADVGLRPWVVWVVQSDGRCACAVQVEGVEGVTTQAKFRLARVAET